MADASDESRQIGLAAELSTRYAPPPCPQGNTVEWERRRVRLGGQQRLALSLLGGGLLTLLALALVLQPANDKGSLAGTGINQNFSGIISAAL